MGCVITSGSYQDSSDSPGFKQIRLTRSQSGPSPCLIPEMSFIQNRIADLQHLLNLRALCVFCFLIVGGLLAVVDIRHFGVHLGREEDVLSGFKAK